MITSGKLAMLSSRLLFTVLVLWAAVTAPSFAAGYHYEVDVSSQLTADSSGALSALKSSWLYDKSASFLLLDDERSNAAPRKQDLERLAERMMSDLSGFGYFANLLIAGENQDFGPVKEYSLELTGDQRIKLAFTLPLRRPVALDGKQIEIRWRDPTGTGLLLYRSADDVSLGSTALNCHTELENFPDAAHAEVPQVARIQCP